MAPAARPNVVIVVVDCLRGDDFEEESRVSPFLGRLRRESVTFPHCTSVSNWTVPAHVSILTGLYPFEHNVHRLGLRSIPSTLPTLATSLSARGYATQLLSANHNLRPDAGFSVGFDQLAWGIWGETSVRVTSDTQPPFDSRSMSGVDLVRQRLLDQDPGGWWKVARHIAELLPRFPWVLDGFSRMYAGLLRAEGTLDYRVAPWVDTSFSRGLTELSPGRPFLSVVNLMECHEPYLPEPRESASRSDWIGLVTTRQDYVSWVRGHWLPTPRQLQSLRRLYRQKVHAVVQRVEGIVQRLIDEGRWDDTLFILVGDHGQAFGEHGQLFHSGELYEPVTHVPLWIHFPRGENGGTTAHAEASLVDVFPTVMEVVDGSRTETGSGRPLRGLVDGTRPDPTVSVADGVTRYRSLDDLTRPSRGSSQIAICSEGYKVIVNSPGGPTHAYRLGRDPEEATDLWPSLEAELRQTSDRAQRIGGMMHPRAEGTYEWATGARLRQWGYLE
jgi:arylsulfatase A-like enzyme